jgi:hypothetical protein
MPLDYSQIEGLTEEQIAALKKQAEGYESAEQVAGLRQQRDNLLAEKKTAQASADEAAELAKKSAHDASVAKGDVDAVNNSWQIKFDEQTATLGGQISTLLEGNAKSATLAVVNQLAGQLADGDNAELLKPFIEKRLRYEDGKIKITDNDGALTVSTVSDLETEFRTNKMFANIIVANRSNGGGATGGTNTSSGAGNALPKMNGSTAEISAALAQKIPALANLPVN